MGSYSKSYDLVVDTQPMARGIDTVSSQVNRVENAVVAMQTAVIIAENQAADHVCENINRGFFTLIQSQISQKIALRKSEADSILMELQMQSRLLQNIKKRMESDYYMITKRYTSLFESLNKALHNRIFELDKPAVSIVEQEVESFNNRINRLAAAVPVNQLESLSLSQTLAASHTKQNGMKTISSIQSFISEINRQKYKTNRIMTDKIIRSNELKYLPVLITSQNDATMDSEITQIYIPETRDTHVRNQISPSIKENVYQLIPALKWETDSKQNKEKVTGYFNTLLNEADLPERVKQTMLKMYNSNNWQSIKPE